MSATWEQSDGVAMDLTKLALKKSQLEELLHVILEGLLPEKEQ